MCQNDDWWKLLESVMKSFIMQSIEQSSFILGPHMSQNGKKQRTRGWLMRPATASGNYATSHSRSSSCISLTEQEKWISSSDRAARQAQTYLRKGNNYKVSVAHRFSVLSLYPYRALGIMYRMSSVTGMTRFTVEMIQSYWNMSSCLKGRYLRLFPRPTEFPFARNPYSRSLII